MLVSNQVHKNADSPVPTDRLHELSCSMEGLAREILHLTNQGRMFESTSMNPRSRAVLNPSCNTVINNIAVLPWTDEDLLLINE